MVPKKSYVLLLILLLAVFTCIVGCSKNTLPPSEDTEPDTASSGAEAEFDQESDYPETYMITDENYFDYQPGLECSAFASAYVLRHFGEEAEGLKLFENFPGKLSGGTGVYPSGVEQFWNDREGYTAEFKSDGAVDELKRLVSKGVPVIVFIHVEEPYETTHNTHYLPLIGYDADYLYFAESLEYLANCKDEPDLPYNRKTEQSKFERLWTNIDSAWDNPYFVITKTSKGFKIICPGQINNLVTLLEIFLN